MRTVEQSKQEWQAFSDAAEVLLFAGEDAGSLIREVLARQDHVWDEQEAGRARL